LRRKRRDGSAWDDDDRPAIVRITAIRVRRCRDTGQRTAYVGWIDDRGDVGVTEGPVRPDGTPVHAYLRMLWSRAVSEGVVPRLEDW